MWSLLKNKNQICSMFVHLSSKLIMSCLRAGTVFYSLLKSWHSKRQLVSVCKINLVTGKKRRELTANLGDKGVQRRERYTQPRTLWGGFWVTGGLKKLDYWVRPEMRDCLQAGCVSMQVRSESAHGTRQMGEGSRPWSGTERSGS